MNVIINNYRVRKLKDKYFITTDSGSYAILNNNDFLQLQSGNISEELKDKLLESEIILDESNKNEFARDLRKRNSFMFHGPSLHIVVVTLRCNMNCVYCHASSAQETEKGFDMDKKTAEKTVDFIFQSPSPSIMIEFQGGEPLLNWEIVKHIIKYAKEKNKICGKKLKFSIVSNFSCMDEEKMDYLINQEVSICTSLDGPKNVHDKNRIMSGASNYDQVVYWIKKLKEEYAKRKIKKQDVNALVTLTKESLKYPEKMVDEYVNLNLNRIHLRFLNNLGVAQKTWQLIKYSTEEYLEFWKKALKHIKTLNSKNIDINERMEGIIFEKISSKYDPGYLDLRSPCGAVIGQMVYNYNGDIFTCDEGRMIGDNSFLLGNVRGGIYKKVTTCEKSCAVINASINNQFVCDDCAYKPYCGLCPVCSLAEHGNIITPVSQSERCKVFMAQFDWVVTERFINKNRAIKDNK